MKLLPIVILLITVSPIPSIAGSGIKEDARPNILLILVDDMGYSDLGFMGSEIQTPNLDKLATNGLVFANFTNCAKCETTRTTLMSGRYHTEIEKGKADNIVTIPEVLNTVGYQSLMVGKWHIFDTPWERGFEHYFGFLEGATNHFTGIGSSGTNTYYVDQTPYEIPPDFYTTDKFTDFSTKYIRERDKDKPFFMYLAYNAPHYPLHAPKKDVMKYRGKYMDGWEALRETRYKEMKKRNIIPNDMILSDPEPDVRAWDSLTDAEKDDMDLRMATYAGMIDHVDQQIGRIINTLKKEGIFENTLILFLSDNGACPFDRTEKATLENGYKPWDGKSYYCYPKEWANACNTPFRKYKQNQNEGGISTPLIAHWPKGISVPGTFDRQRGHLVDFHATFRELAGAQYPTEFNGNKIGPARGISLVPAFSGDQREEHPYLYQNFSNKYTALIMGDWKLVDEKYLYNLANDRTESKDLKDVYPEKFEQMMTDWKRLDDELNLRKPKNMEKKS